jgi:signal transduction histidine kinase/CheY-like chemotaxis protein
VLIRRDEAGWQVLGLDRDITSQYEIALLRDSQSALLLSNLVNQADCLLWQATVTRTDRPPDEFEQRVHSNLAWDFFIPPSDLYERLFGRTDPGSRRRLLWSEHNVPELEAMTRRCNEALEQGLPHYEQEFHFTTPDGHNLVLHEKTSIRRMDSTHWNLVGVITDVTRQRQVEDALAREKEQIAKLESVGLLAGGIAHDFNNILTTIAGNLSLLGMEGDAGGGEEFVQEAQLAVERARSLTQQLLTFARGGEPVLASTQLSDVIVEVVRFVLHGTAIQCDYDFTADLWAAHADKGQIAQVIQNLVINARQAMPKGGRLRIAAKNQASPDGPCVHVTLSDTGIGIPEADLPRLFEPYFTTKATGNGLGLATVYSIVKKHRGRIAVESKPGVGTTFSILLPALPNARAARAPGSGAAARFKGRALLLEDEAAIQRVAAAMLKLMGLEVTCAANRQAAVAACEAARSQGRRFDVALMDLTIPGDIGGEETLVALRQIDPGLKAIVCSGYSENPVLANHQAYGFDGVLPKPYDRHQLASALEKLLKAPPREAAETALG